MAAAAAAAPVGAPVSVANATAQDDRAHGASVQLKMMEEECAVVDDMDRILRRGTKKELHLMENINKGLLHRAFSVFLFDSENRLLLQQRAAVKITFPLYWTNTCCSHPIYDMEDDELVELDQLGVKRAARRKLQQELGIPPEDLPLSGFHFLTRLHYVGASAADPAWGEHEIDYVMFFRGNVRLAPNPLEVERCRYVTAAELQQLVAATTTGAPATPGVAVDGLDWAGPAPLLLTPWFALLEAAFLRRWWWVLRTRDRMPDPDPDVIHRMLDGKHEVVHTPLARSDDARY